MFTTYSDSNIFIRKTEYPRAKDTIFYIHGLGESGLGFETLIADKRLSAWNHIALDIPGYGKSAWLPSGLTFDGISGLISRWIRKNIKQKVIIFGHSMGGVLGTLLCESSPEIVKAFINVEGNISFDDCTFSSRAAKYTIREFISGGFDNMRDAVYKAGIKDKSLRGYYASLRMCAPSAFHKNSVELVKLSKEETLARRFSQLTVPSLYILGAPYGVGKYSQKLLAAQGVKYRSIANSGHWPMGDNPDEFISAIKGFLKINTTTR